MKNWSRKRKLALAVLILILSRLIIFSMSSLPSPTLELAIRRQEKQRLIGPSKIISVTDFEMSPWDHLVLGKTERGYITYEYTDSLGWDDGDLNYYAKETEGTIFCTEYWYRTGEEEWLPILLFPENQRSTQANMSLTITVDGETKAYSLEGQKKDSSFYLFRIPTEELGGQHFWLLQQALSGAYSEYVLSGAVEIEIEYFDVSGSLVDTYAKSVMK